MRPRLRPERGARSARPDASPCRTRSASAATTPRSSSAASRSSHQENDRPRAANQARWPARALPSAATPTVQPCASSSVGGRLVELHIRRSTRVRGHRIYVRHGHAARARRAPARVRGARSTTAIDYHTPWLERQLANAPEPRLGLERLRLDRGAGPARGARADLADRAVGGGRARRRRTRDSRLRDQRSRWGSCSSKGALSFNWRLVLAPHDVLDYVVVHEVCHLVELHHGPAFWRLVERRRPEYLRVEATGSTTHGWEILAYRPPLEAAA